jgi:hypothetical protein
LTGTNSAIFFFSVTLSLGLDFITKLLVVFEGLTISLDKLPEANEIGVFAASAARSSLAQERLCILVLAAVLAAVLSAILRRDARRHTPILRLHDR